MDFNKLMQWMELAQKYQTTDFWNGVFEQTSFNQFMKENMDMSSPQGPSPDNGAAPMPRSDFPAVDIYVTDTEVIILADLAGYTKENIQVSVSGARLLLRGSMNSMIAGQAFLKERSQDGFRRIIDLPEPAESNLITAKFENGLLRLTYNRQFMEEERVNIE
ncbi:HSP20 family protein [Bacillus sp. OV322]|uniref:Hsp20/alpha crystallin family protein n=1 Tax=Bacillus sp. OV322 TaxID=1882764 RepID=UPI0008ECF2F7|nr:Hsp20/alpha crystallin family protein [Bacillus sp. OV322]SFC52967.1 HSP20 family protein [Bacillus sp. OV322]